MATQPGLQFAIVDQAPQLESLLSAMESADRVAVDTEADSMHHYYAKVCLIQLAIGEDYYILDPLAGLNLDEFMEVLSQKRLILHGADYDLRMMRSSFGFRPRNEVFDTMLAAQLLGYTKFGLTSLVQQLFNVTLTDFGKKTDWSRRPLGAKELDYACNDTRFLQPMADVFTAKLEELGRLEWHRESCAELVKATETDRVKDDDDEWRIKGKRLLDRQQLAFLRGIWLWREKEAQKVDLPPFKILINQKMIELAIWASNNPKKPLTQGPNLPRNCHGRRLEALKRAIKKAANLPKSEWPYHKKAKPFRQTDPHITQRIEAMVKECGRVARKLEIEQPVIASRATIKAVAHQKPASVEEMVEQTPLMQWQAELLFPGFRKIMEKFP
ncbi:hypothetical protein GF373_14710 [bacterium]|nr:hypothetical protein [bacterium]